MQDILQEQESLQLELKKARQENGKITKDYA